MNQQTFLIKFLGPVFLGLFLTITAVTGLALAQEGGQDMPMEESADEEDVQITEPISYARVITDHAPVYTSPLDAASGLPPTRTMKPGFLWVTVESKKPIRYNDELWYKINHNEYMRAEHLTFHNSSEFQGVFLEETPEKPFGWIVRDTPVLSGPGYMPLTDTVYLARYDMITIYETIWLGDVGWHRIGPEAWVELYDVGAVRAAERPEEIFPHERWIEVDLFEQTLTVYEGDRMIFATLISSGLYGWETPEGLFRIKSKVKKAKMSGGGKLDHYFIEDVTATMYFTESYSLHAAYWHDSFGKFKSHGCVNMSPHDADWLFEWTTPLADPKENKTRASREDLGTWVWVHQ